MLYSFAISCVFVLLDGELLCTFSVNHSQQKTVTSVLSAAGVTQLLWPDELQL